MADYDVEYNRSVALHELLERMTEWFNDPSEDFLLEYNGDGIVSVWNVGVEPTCQLKLQIEHDFFITGRVRFLEAVTKELRMAEPYGTIHWQGDTVFITEEERKFATRFVENLFRMVRWSSHLATRTSYEKD